MDRIDRPSIGISLPSCLHRMSQNRLVRRAAACLLSLIVSVTVFAQDEGETQDQKKYDPIPDVQEKIQKRKDLDQIKRKKEKPDFEIRVIRSSPSDSITFLKRNHWGIYHLDMISNNSEREIDIRTEHMQLADTPHRVRFEREAFLEKGKAGLWSVPMFVSHVHTKKMIKMALFQPGGILPIQPPGYEPQACTVLRPDQFFMVVLSPEPFQYEFLNDFQCVLPGTDDEDSENPVERRYFFVVMPFQPKVSLVADRMQAWSATSFLIWDGYDPELLSIRQREALIDWLHWGGQLIISGGGGWLELGQTFLGPYLPADTEGSAEISNLDALSQQYRSALIYGKDGNREVPIPIDPKKPIYMQRFAPRPGTRTRVSIPDPANAGGTIPLIMERKVGRGRIVLSAMSLYQPHLVKWRGAYDRMWQQVVMDVPETRPIDSVAYVDERSYRRVHGRSLSKFSLLARDLGFPRKDVSKEEEESDPELFLNSGYIPAQPKKEFVDLVSEWSDSSDLPATAREVLLQSSGIEIPPREFVLKAAILYLITLVPLNWLVCRFALRRTELAWVAAPIITILFSVGIVRMARINVGLDSVSREIDLVEIHANYGRAHTTRFTCVYSGSRRQYSFIYKDPTALALPMAMGKQRGEYSEKITTRFGGQTVSMGVDGEKYEIDPRSVGMTRAEQMVPLGGPVAVRSTEEGWTIDNQTVYNIWDCHIMVNSDGKLGAHRIGDLSPGMKVRLGQAMEVIDSEQVSETAVDATQKTGERVKTKIALNTKFKIDYSRIREFGDLAPDRFIEALSLLPENDVYLIGWRPMPVAGQEISPSPDFQHGISIFVVHLDMIQSEEEQQVAQNN